MSRTNQKIQDRLAKKLLPVFESSAIGRAALFIIMVFIGIICHFSSQIGLSITTLIGFFLLIMMNFVLTFSKNETIKEASLFVSILTFFTLINAIGLFAIFYLFSSMK